MFFIVSTLIGFYAIWRGVWLLPCSRPIKWAATAVVLLVSQRFFILSTFWGTMASPEVPFYVLAALGWFFGALLLATVLWLVTDLIGLLAYLPAKPMGRWLLSNARLRLGIGFAALLLATLGIWEALRIPDVRTVEVYLPQLPQEFEGFRLVQLTDLHASRLLQRPWMEAVVEKANALKPDLMLLSGDMVDGAVADRRDDVEPLRRLSAPLGVFAIPGNHEYYAEYRQWMSHFETLGLRLLLNQHVTLFKEHASIVLAGITDPAAARFGLPMPDVKASLAGVSQDNTVVLLSPRHSGAALTAQLGVDLQLSGHTHGGQVFGMHWITQLVNEGYVSGTYDVEGMQLYVSNGTGLWNGFPMRLGPRSEITQFVLHAPSSVQK